MRSALLSLLLIGAGACDDDESHSPPADAGADQLADASTPGDAGDASTPGDAGDAFSPPDGDGKTCGYKGTGTPRTIAPGIELCVPQVVCTAETCPPPVGTCSAGSCVFAGGYKGLATLPEAWATYYCDLTTGGCHGVTQIDYAEVTAGQISTALGIPTCAASPGAAKCVGIAASSPLLVGNSQEAIDPATGKPVQLWGLGLTEASGLCYELKGPGGTVLVALTDRCGGYCKCNGSGYQECGPCVSAADMAPNCPCVGTVPGLHTECCGMGCPTTQANCDWCASNNHPHFDLDTAAFNKLCGAEAINGSCKLTSVSPTPCLAPKSWPPGGGAGCKQGSFWCSGPSPHHEQVPGTSCCCNWDLKPQADGTCA